MHIAILVTNTDTSRFSTLHPSDEARFSAMMRLARAEWLFSAVDCVRDMLPADPRDFDGYIVTGSPASANDPDDWILDLKEFIRDCVAERVPLFGTCFGHQVIAAALGGFVQTVGWRLGLYEGPASLAWRDEGGPIRLYASHQDQVTMLPDGAVLLGGTEDCPVGAYEIPGRVFASQYHPEMPLDFIAALIEETAPRTGPEVTARARKSIADGAAEMERFAQSVVGFFEAAQA